MRVRTHASRVLGTGSRFCIACGTWSPSAGRCQCRADVPLKVRASLCCDVSAKAAASVKNELTTQCNGCSSKCFATVVMADVAAFYETSIPCNRSCVLEQVRRCAPMVMRIESPTESSRLLTRTRCCVGQLNGPKSSDGRSQQVDLCPVPPMSHAFPHAGLRGPSTDG